jgi:predicted transposase/invertase (TIGR01784 family)
MEPPTPHDSLVRAILSRPEHAAGYLRHLLRPALAARFDWSTLRLVSGSYVDQALRGRHSDLLFSVKCDGADVLIYLLLEHQSTDDPLMAFRLLLYMVRIWEQMVREKPTRTRLPAIVPLVLHHSEQGWTSPIAFQDLIDLQPEGLAAVAKHVPHFRFILDDLRAETDDDLRARAMSALARLALFCLRHAREPWVLVQELARWLDLIREVRAAPGGREAMELIWRYIFVTSNPARPKDLVDRLLAVVGLEAKEDVVTVADWLQEQGRQSGVRGTLLKLLRARFGALPDAARARIDTADADQLDAWFDRALSAASLDDALADA